MSKIDISLKKSSQPSAISMTSSRPLATSFELKCSNQSFHSAISPSNKPLQTRDKPLPPIPKGLNGALDRISHRRRDSIALPRVMGSFNRGMERVRRHSLVASELDHTKLILPATTNTMNSPLLTSSEVKPEISIEVNDVDSKEDYSKEEEAEIGIAIKMTIVSVRARLIYIGCKGLDS